MLQPQNVALQRITFQNDEMRVSYSFSVDGEDRIASYDIGDDDALKVQVRRMAEGAPLVELFANRAGVRARTPDGEFTLKKGRQVLPPTTDQRSVWLLAQNFLFNTTTMPQRHLDRVAALLPADHRLAFGRKQKGASNERFFPQLKDVFSDIWDWLGGGGDCLNPDQSTTCTEEDTAGNLETVTFNCACGLPMCTNQRITIDVPVLIYNADTGAWDMGTEQETYVVCVCWCILVG